MKTITPAVELFTFEELNERAKNKAINNLLDFWLQDDGFVWDDALPAFKQAVAEADKMLTPWFAKEIIFRDCKDYIYMELDNWYFDCDGEEYGQIELVDQEYEDVCG